MSGVPLKMRLEERKKTWLNGYLAAGKMDRSRRALLSGLRQTRYGNVPTKHFAGLLRLWKLSGRRSSSSCHGGLDCLG
jgi:hypothetical protein